MDIFVIVIVMILTSCVYRQGVKDGIKMSDGKPLDEPIKMAVKGVKQSTIEDVPDGLANILAYDPSKVTK